MRRPARRPAAAGFSALGHAAHAREIRDSGFARHPGGLTIPAPDTGMTDVIGVRCRISTKQD
jgi:hypothetical protein